MIGLGSDKNQFSESTKINIKERNQLFRPAFQERGKEGESPRGHFIPVLDKFDPAGAQEILVSEIFGLQKNQVLFFNFIWVLRVLEDVLGDAQSLEGWSSSSRRIIFFRTVSPFDGGGEEAGTRRHILSEGGAHLGKPPMDCLCNVATSITLGSITT